MDYCTPARRSRAAASSPTRSFTGGSSSTARSSSTWSATARIGTLDERRLEPGLRRRRRARRAQSFPNPPYTTLDTNPPSREKPFLYVDAKSSYNVFVPDVQHDSHGHDVGRRPDAGPRRSRSSGFFIAKPADSRPDDQQRARPGQEPPLHAGHLQRRPDDRGEARRTRSSSASGWRRSTRQRRRGDDGRRRHGRRDLRASSSTPARSTRPCCCRSARRADAGGDRSAERPDDPTRSRRVLPHRRRRTSARRPSASRSTATT